VETGSRPRIVLSANTAWFVTNFCRGLIRGLRAAGYEPVVIAPVDSVAARDLRDLGVEHLAVRIERSGINPLADLSLFFTYRRFLRRLRPVAYCGFTIKPNIYGSLAAASLKIPAIPNVSGLGTAFMRPGPLQWLVSSLYRRAFRRAEVVFFQNAEDRQLFVDRAIIGDAQGRVLPGLGVDVDHFAPASMPGGAPVFLLVARLLKDKGVLEFVEAARSLRATVPEASFQLLGPIDDGNRTAIHRAELETWVEQGVVEYLGTTQDVRPFIAASSAVVLPSYREGLPRSLLEAAAMARPLIATDVPGCRDIVDDGENGYLCAVRDSASLAAAMRKFAFLPRPRRLAMGEAARRKVQEQFSEKIVLRAYLDLLSGLEVAQSRM
jgi:glycosyltransferase involved in cell wall biosynthesis